MKVRLFLIFIFVFVSLLAFADPCEVLLAEGHVFSHAEPEGRSISTSSLITYLSLLLDEGLIGDVHLVRLAEGLERGEIVNPISEEEARTNTDLLIQRNGLELMISEELDKKTLLKWVRDQLSQRNVIRVQRKVAHRDTEKLIHLMEFIPIQPGMFMMGAKKKKKVRIGEPFEVSIFLVTQWQWAMVMGMNPSAFRDGLGPDSFKIKINGEDIVMQPNHPVERVSWKYVQKFIRKLNKLSKADDPLIYKVISDHSQGKVYRLPTEAEWEYVARAGTDTKFSFGDDESQLGKFAWFDENSDEQTHEVGLKRPNPWGLYDVHGNVSEWVQDLSGKYNLSSIPNAHLLQNKTPIVTWYVVRGGDWSSAASDCSSVYRSNGDLNDSIEELGFRLVRVDSR